MNTYMTKDKSNTKQYTFWQLIQQYTIEIPIIQRDYAQGREEDKVNLIRKGLLQTLKDVLVSNEIEDEGKLNFDFVYGRIQNFNFIPLDGQQRLTTLFLLHWYIFTKEKIEDKDKSIQKLLSKFSYKTRISSRDFCLGLATSNLSIPDSNSGNNLILSEIIEDSSWFFLSWKKDPTIKAMLNMLNAIHEVFYHTENLWERLIKDDAITFQFLNLGDEDFQLTDSLYIKMNARGKPLTDFENFKARFIQLLGLRAQEYTNETLSYEEKQVSYKDYFSFKIDGEWTDLFWHYRKNRAEVDEPLLRFFTYITEWNYYKNIDAFSIKKFDFENFDLIKEIYKKQDCVLYLFKCFDFFAQINATNQFFDDLFSLTKHEQNKVKLFSTEYKSSSNLFERCILDQNFNLYEKILLGSILEYCLKYNLSNVNIDLSDFVRVIRNLLLRVRQQNETIFNSNLRIENLARIYQDINLLMTPDVYSALIEEQDKLGGNRSFSNESISFESHKAKIIKANIIDVKSQIQEIEDFKYLMGAIHLLDLDNNIQNLSIFSQSLNEIWSVKDDSLIIRSFLTVNKGDSVYDGIYIKNCKMGELWYLGKGDDWYTILTNSGDREGGKSLMKVFPQFLLNYSSSLGNTPKEKLEIMIKEWLKGDHQKDWRYYFIKYKSITDTVYNYFSFDGDFNCEILNSVSNNPLLAYHINPYVKAVINELSSAVVVKEWCSVQYGEPSHVYLKNDCIIYCEDEGWNLYLIHLKKEIDERLRHKYNLGKDNLLKEFDKRDRIELLIDFCKDYYESPSFK